MNADILPVHWDDFVLPRKKNELLLKKAKDRTKVFELHNNYYGKLRQIFKKFKKGGGVHNVKIFDPRSGKVNIPKSFDLSKKILVAEGVFLFHPKLLNNIWDKRIYLDGNTREIDTRRVRREKKKWGKEYFPETHPDSYFRLVTLALKRYRKLYSPEKKADLRIIIS